MPGRMTVILSALVLTGCATCDPVSIPVPARVPEACLTPCEYAGPTEIATNGALLEAWRGRLDQVACLQARLQCVRRATESP